MARVAGQRYRWKIVVSLFTTLFVLAMLAIPILVVVRVVRRVREMTQRFQDPTRLQRVLADTAAAALRRAGADPAPPGPPAEPPRPAIVQALPRSPRLRTRQQPLAPLGGLDLGDRFRLSEPPDLSEPQGPAAFGGGWIAVVALLGAGAYYFLR